MPDHSSISSRIAAYLTTIAFICCLYGAWVWTGRPGEPDQLHWFGFYAVASATMLTCRAHLAGVDLRGRARQVVIAGRRAVDAAPDARHVATVAVAVLMVTSTFVGGLALVGTQPVTDDQSGTAAAAAGDELWNTTTGASVESSPTIIDGRAFVGSNDGNLYAFNTSTGEQQWSASTGNNISFSSPTVYQGTVYIGSTDGLLYAFDAATGTQEWTFDTGAAIDGSPTVANDTVFVGSGNGNLYAVDPATGTERWNESVGSEVDASPTAKDGTVYITSTSSSDTSALTALDVSDGTQQWRYTGATAQPDSSPTVANGRVFFGSNAGYVRAINATDGSQIWSQLYTDIQASPTVKNGTLYVGARDGNLYALDAATGTQQWAAGIGDGTHSSPTVAGGTVYVGESGGYLYAVDAQSGSTEWSYKLGGQYATGITVQSSPTVANGNLFVGSSNGKLYALDTSHGLNSSGTRNELRTLGHVGQAEVPTSLSSLTISNTDASSTSLSWNAQNVDTTRVEYKTTDNSTWNTFSTLSGSTTTETLTGLKNGEAYDVRVVADSDSTIKSTTSVTTTLPPDDQPVLSTPAESQITVDRETVTTNYGDVEIQYRETGTSTWTTTSVPYDFTTIDLTNLSDETEYEVRVRTITEHSTSAWTTPVTATTLTPTEPVAGVVENQNGQPVANATVTVTGIDREQLSVDPDQLDARIEEIENQIKNAKPPDWEPDRQLTGSGSLFGDASTEYVAAHPRGDWGLTAYSDNAQLGNPRVQLPANEQFVLSVWDPTKTGLAQNAIDRQLPGATVDGTNIVIESIDHQGGTVDRQVIGTNSTYSNEIAGISTYSVEFAQTQLPAGFYRVYPEGSPETSYVIVVGDPQQIVGTIRADLRDQQGELTAQAQEVRDYLNKDVLRQYKSTTNETGHWAVDVPDSVTRVTVQAHKAPPGLDQDPKNASLQDIRELYRVTDYNGSYVMPADAGSYDVPNNDITVRVAETEAPQYADLGKYKNATEAFRQLLQNLSYSDLPSAFQQRLNESGVSNETREQMERMAERLQKLSNQNSQLQARAEELANQDLSEITINDSSNAELRQMINAQQQALTELRSTIEASETETDVSGSVATIRKTFPVELTSDDVLVRAHYSNGTTRVVPSEYITIDQSAGTIAGVGETQVSVEEYPVGDASNVRFTFDVANAEALGKASEVVRNPNAAGDRIGLDAISLSSLRPGPDEQVDVTLVGDDETQVTNITNVRAVAPDGTLLNTSTDGPRTASFTTSGQGRHYVELTFETASGATGTLTHRIKAGTSDRAMPPGIRLKDTPYGTMAVVGDGFEAGDVAIQQGGTVIDVTAQIGVNEDAPANMHVYAHGIDVPPKATLSINVVRGPEEQNIQRNVQVTAHLPAMTSENAVLYRGDSALPRDGEGRIADVSTSSDATTITTVTDANGRVTIGTNNNPDLSERMIWWLDRNTPDIPFVGQLPASTLLGQLPAPTAPTVPQPDVIGALVWTPPTAPAAEITPSIAADSTAAVPA